jgi:ankyrin repeat protein
VAATGWLEAALVLLEGGADPNRADDRGVTPLMHAARWGQLEVLRLLLARGAAMDVAHPACGRTAFHYARLALFPKRKQKYQNGNIHRKLKVPTSTILLRLEVQYG